MSAPTSGLARLTIRAPRRSLDLAIPHQVPLAELLPEVLRRASEGDREAFEQVEANTLKSIGRMTEEGRPSTGQDIVKGRRTEIDFLNGLVADKGDEAGIKAPTHRALVQVVKEVERQEATPSPVLVDRVWELSGVQPVAIAQVAR